MAERRRSIFDEQPQISNIKGYSIASRVKYPQGYKQKLKQTFAEFQEYTERCKKTGLKIKAENEELRNKTFDENLLTTEQVDFFASLMDFNQYLSTINEFNTSMRILNEQLNYSPLEKQTANVIKVVDEIIKNSI